MYLKEFNTIITVNLLISSKIEKKNKKVYLLVLFDFNFLSLLFSSS